MNKELPILYTKKEECCGCTACYSICPKGAISMVEDSEGFLYPSVDENKCVCCYSCLKVCAFKV
ncbi:MAG: 4Fe-4S dicluster domain-containing protein [Ruminococcus sp.]